MTADPSENVHPQPAIHVADLVVSVPEGRHEKRLLNGITFDVTPGTFVAVIGASGCGKSTLIRTLGGMMPASSGQVLFGGHAVTEIRDQYPLAIGYLPQFGAFHPDLSVRENLRDALDLRLPGSVRPEVRREWMDHIIRLARLEGFLEQPYRTLSGGQMRRMALAEELIGDPAFLLLDELTSGLDEFSDREMMAWLHELSHVHGKTIILVTHATYHLDFCDRILFLHDGHQAQYAPYSELLESHGVTSVSDLFELYQGGGVSLSPVPGEGTGDIYPQPLKTARPPLSLAQLPALVRRQARLLIRDHGQIILQLALILTFPALVAVFAYEGLPQVRQLTLALETNIVHTLAEKLKYLSESYRASSLVSGLTMFQVVLLTLIGANNGAREIAKERSILAKELRAGLSPAAYITTKTLQLTFFCLVQALWMTWFVKTICGFPGAFTEQFLVLWATIMAMSATCLAISAATPSPERASLLAIYLVGFQLPLSGAALALPEWLSLICRPFIAAYWGWSGYLKTLEQTRHYDIVKQSTETFIAPYNWCLMVLGLHIVLALFAAWFFTGRIRNYS